MNILTFDIEDWYNCDFISGDFEWDKWEYRVDKMLIPILDELDRRGIKGTFFCLGWLAEKHPDIIREIDRRGHEVGCHTYQHELSTRFTPEQFVEDTMKAKRLIEEAIGHEIKYFRAPGFSITEKNPWAIDKLVEMGFECDCSAFAAHHDYGGMPNYGKPEPALLKTKNGNMIKEFPVNFHSVAGKNIVFSGGGFFRLFPYWLIKRWGKDADYLMTYFHPRDFDKDQPVVQGLPLMRRFKSYVGISGNFKKWNQLLDDFDFLTVGQAIEKIDWEKARIIEI